ncbi:malate dehydrogenase [Kocuria dechangensis]|uniref:Malate dehydrogenase n=1 Tax=Kocuria dechangensis TaxID=1176249 RepID=A0A917LY60_9MICC|nr:Ldh family oxidoreductase [Kocuria dechangensis]GGG64806.1 malate dehydrogenase [Kocuria dechangensis]
MQHYPAERLRDQIGILLRQWGMPEEKIDTTTEAMVDADLSGIDSHGISMLMNYDSLMQQHRMDLQAPVRTVTETPAIAVLDAGGGLGHPVAVQAVDLAITKARALGIGAVAVRNSHHFGATGFYVRRAAEQGLIALATTTARVLSVIPTGGSAPGLSTNPIAFAAPTAEGEPFVLDMSTSTVAMNKVKAYALKEQDIPEGWVIDEAGRPVTDSAAAFAYLRDRPEGGLVPLGGSTPVSGGHKGYGLSLMVQILSAALSDAALPGRGTERGDNIGHFFLVIDPEVFNPGGGAAAYTAELIAMMRATPPVDPGTAVLVPGDPEAAARKVRQRKGVPVPGLLLEAIREVCERNDVPFLLQSEEATV